MFIKPKASSKKKEKETEKKQQQHTQSPFGCQIFALGKVSIAKYPKACSISSSLITHYIRLCNINLTLQSRAWTQLFADVFANVLVCLSLCDMRSLILLFSDAVFACC